MSITTWRMIFIDRYPGIDFKALEFNPSDLDLDKEFDDGWGSSEGVPFFAWSFDHVYFPVVHDGREWIGRVPRNPTIEADPVHFGGE